MWWVLWGTLVLKLILAAWFPLTEDEAYFTMWGEFPALGYSEHPPMIGWILWPLVQISKTRFMVRLPAVLSTISIGWGIYWLLKDRGREKAALAATLYLLSPLNLIYIIITTDTPLLFFSFWSIAAFHHADQTKKPVWYILSGILLSMAFLSKYFAVLLGLSYLVYYLVSKKTWKTTLGIILLYLCVLPAGILDIYWNYNHSWLHINSNLFYRNADAVPNPVTPLAYIATAAYLLLPAGLIECWRARREAPSRIRTHRAFVFVMLYFIPMGFFALLSIVKKIGLHWLLSFTPVPFLIAWAMMERDAFERAIRFTTRYSLVHLLIIVGALLTPLSLLKNLSEYDTIIMSVKADELAEKLEPYTRGRKLGAYGYGQASILSFYNKGFFDNFSTGTHHGRQHDIITDWREWAGRDVMIFYRGTPKTEDFKGMFDSMRIETIEVRGQRFYLLLAENLNFEILKERFLIPVRDRYYNVPAWLPMKRCFYRDRYFLENNGN